MDFDHKYPCSIWIASFRSKKGTCVYVNLCVSTVAGGWATTHHHTIHLQGWPMHFLDAGNAEIKCNTQMCRGCRKRLRKAMARDKGSYYSTQFISLSAAGFCKWEPILKSYHTSAWWQFRIFPARKIAPISARIPAQCVIWKVYMQNFQFWTFWATFWVVFTTAVPLLIQ